MSSNCSFNAITSFASGTLLCREYSIAFCNHDSAVSSSAPPKEEATELFPGNFVQHAKCNTVIYEIDIFCCSKLRCQDDKWHVHMQSPQFSCSVCAYHRGATRAFEMHTREMVAKPLLYAPNTTQSQHTSDWLMNHPHVSMHLQELLWTQLRQRMPEKHRNTLWPNERASQVPRRAVILTARERRPRRSG